jgi:hypothetical protein
MRVLAQLPLPGCCIIPLSLRGYGAEREVVKEHGREGDGAFAVFCGEDEICCSADRVFRAVG